MQIDEVKFRYVAIKSIEEYLNTNINEYDSLISFTADELVRRAKEYYSKPINRNIKSQSQGQRSITYVDNIDNPFMITDDLKALLPTPYIRLF